MSHSHSSSASTNIVGAHYRVGKKIGEGSFGVIFEGAYSSTTSVPFALFLCSSPHFEFLPCPGTNLLNSQTVAIKFVRRRSDVRRGRYRHSPMLLPHNRNRERRRLHSCGMSAGRIVSWLDVVSLSSLFVLPNTSTRPCIGALSLYTGDDGGTHDGAFFKNAAGIPQIYHFGQEGLHNILVIDLLGPSLEDLFDMCGRKFTIKTVCMAARQMVC